MIWIATVNLRPLRRFRFVGWLLVAGLAAWLLWRFLP